MAPRSVWVVDVANVMGSRPDGWWRDREGAASRLLGELAGLLRPADGPDDGTTAPQEIVAVVEGRAAGAQVPAGAGAHAGERLRVARAPGSGDDEIVRVAQDCLAHGMAVLVVTADRGLRARLPHGCRVAGPRVVIERLANPGGR